MTLFKRKVYGLLASGSGAAVVGATATSAALMGMTPTVQYHPNTSTLTMRANGTMTGYITAGVLTVTVWANGTGQTVREGVQVSGPGVTTFKVTKSKNAVSGATGDYYTDTVQTVGSSGSPITLTTTQTEVSTISDLMGNADLSMADPAGAVPGMGPTLMVDGYGRKFLRFAGGASVTGAWLRNLTLANLDSANMAWFMVGMVRSQNTVAQSGGAGGGTIVHTGAQEGTGGGAGSVNAGANVTIYDGMPTWGGANGYNMPLNYSGDANISRMFLGEQMQVLGTVNATTDGLNGGTTLTATAANRCIQTWVNDKSITLTTSPTGTNRVMNSSASGNTGFTVGRASTASNNNAFFDLYELVGFLTGQLGTVMANVPGKAAAVSAAMMTNYGLVTLTKNLILFGDSRSVYGEGGGAGISSDGSGYSTASVLAEQGRAYSLPANVRILCLGQPGEGIAKARALLDMNPNLFSNGASPALNTGPNMLFGGGNDFASFFMGVNESGGAEWPTTAAGGGSAAINTTALGDDLYSGGYTCTASVTNTANATSGTFTAGTGTLFSGYRVNDVNYSGGQEVTISGSNITFARAETTTHTATLTTFAVDGYRPFVNTLCSRGFKVLAYAEPRTPTASSPGITQAQLASHLLNDLIPDTAGTYPGKVITGDAATISVSGSFPFGANYQGLSVPGAEFVDLVHMTQVGKVRLVGGADTAANGYSKRIQALLAL